MADRSPEESHVKWLSPYPAHPTKKLDELAAKWRRRQVLLD